MNIGSPLGNRAFDDGIDEADRGRSLGIIPDHILGNDEIEGVGTCGIEAIRLPALRTLV